MRRIILACLFLSAQIVAFSQFGRDLFSASSLSISKRTGVKKNEFCVNVLTPLLTPSTLVGAGNVSFNLGTGLRVYQTNVGYVELNYNKNLFLTETTEDPSYYAINKLDRTNYSITSNFNILKRGKAKETHISIEGISGGNYYTIVDVIHKQAINIRAGLSQTFSQTFSKTYSQLLWNTYPDLYPLTYGGNTSCWINQYSKNYKLGISLSDFVNHSIEGITNDDQTFKGHKGRLLNFYFDVSYAYKNMTSPVLYRYYAYGDPQLTSPFSNPMREDSIDMTDFLKYKRTGFSLGFEKIEYLGKRNIRTVTTAIEIGSQTGYFDNFMRSLYFELKFICLGLGGLSKS